MTEMTEADRLYREGVTAIRAGDPQTGRDRLLQAVELDEMHEQAWLWLSAVVETDQERIICLENVLTINPAHETARKGLEKLRGKVDAAANPGRAGLASTPPAAPDPPLPVPAPVRDPLPPLSIDSDWSQAGRSGTEAPAPVQTRDHPPSPSAADESWRQSLYMEPDPENQGAITGRRSVTTGRLQPDEDAGDYGLGDAWLGALIFRVRGAYRAEVRAGDIGHFMINLALTAFFSAVLGVLYFQVVLVPFGGVEGFLNEALTSGGVADMGSIQLMSRWLNTYGLALVIMVTMLGTIFGQFFNGVAIQVAGRFLGGKGALFETLTALSLAGLAGVIVQFIPLLLVIGALLIGGATAAFALFSIAAIVTSLYSGVVQVIAVSTAHQMGVLRTLGTFILAGMLLGFVSTCLSYGLGVLLALGG
jgi:hypothetical protein